MRTWRSLAEKRQILSAVDAWIAKGCTQIEACRRAGVRKNLVQNWKNGRGMTRDPVRAIENKASASLNKKPSRREFGSADKQRLIRQVKNLRVSGLTLQDATKRVGICQSMFSRWCLGESGRDVPPNKKTAVQATIQPQSIINDEVKILGALIRTHEIKAEIEDQLLEIETQITAFHNQYVGFLKGEKTTATNTAGVRLFKGIHARTKNGTIKRKTTVNGARFYKILDETVRKFNRACPNVGDFVEWKVFNTHIAASTYHKVVKQMTDHFLKQGWVERTGRGGKGVLNQWRLVKTEKCPEYVIASPTSISPEVPRG
jgi:transposase-like protein